MTYEIKHKSKWNIDAVEYSRGDFDNAMSVAAELWLHDLWDGAHYLTIFDPDDAYQRAMRGTGTIYILKPGIDYEIGRDKPRYSPPADYDPLWLDRNPDGSFDDV